MKRLIAFVVVVCLGVFGAGVYRLFSIQGLTSADWQDFTEAKVVFDADDIPTITANSWERLIYAQGFVTASERMWQMDLVRRHAGGRLAEWVGNRMLAHDIAKQSEDRIAIADQAVTLLTSEERLYCEAYAKGVNEFLQRYPHRAGIEYIIQRSSPEPWQCRDSILVLLEMTEQLTAREKVKLSQEKIRSRLPSDWDNFLYSQNHPWNNPMFGQKPDESDMPKTEHWLAMTDVPRDEISQVPHTSVNGSNNWGYRGSHGTFLANDPHFKNTVPSVWYLTRLQLSEGEWVVGAGLPGAFGIVIGMNKNIAWSFTNTGMDVDNILWETINHKNNTYLDSIDENGKEEWKPLTKKTFVIKVAGENDVTVTAEFTSRGPLKKDGPDGKHYSRQWLGLNPEYLKMPVVQINRAQSLEEADRAFNRMSSPSQNVLLADRNGNMLYRPSGVFINRQDSSNTRPSKAISGQWLGIEEMNSRWHIKVPKDQGKSTYLATANERIWVDTHGHFWADDDRKDRIRSVLEASEDATQEDMQALQLDSYSRFKKTLSEWVLRNASEHTINAEDRTRLINFSGDAKQDSEIFHLCAHMERQLLNLLITQVKKQFMPQSNDIYISMMTHSVLLKTLSHSKSTAIFGLQPQEVADHLWLHVQKERGALHEHVNRWRAQHPFYASIPVFGNLFAVDEIAQPGSPDAVNAQKPEHGPSLRIVFNVTEPEKSTWILPVGQSGHVAKKTFKSMQKRWVSGESISIF